MATTKRGVADATKRRMALEHDLQEAARVEAEQKIEHELLSNPKFRDKFKGLNKQHADLKESLHRTRVTVKRKAFAITVRHKRLAAIPKEIEKIAREKTAVEGKLSKLERDEQQVVTSMQALKDQAAATLRDRNELPEIAAI